MLDDSMCAKKQVGCLTQAGDRLKAGELKLFASRIISRLGPAVEFKRGEAGRGQQGYLFGCSLRFLATLKGDYCSVADLFKTAEEVSFNTLQFHLPLKNNNNNYFLMTK